MRTCKTGWVVYMIEALKPKSSGFVAPGAAAKQEYR